VLHYRYRFDPQGLPAAERSTLSNSCKKILAVIRRA